MTKVRVTETPVPVFPFGVQDRIAVYNNGPATVYLDSDTSINIAGAYPLPPTGTMTWRADAPLFARTEKGEAQLTFNRHANMSDSSRAQFINPLLVSMVPALNYQETHTFETFETGSCETLLVRGYTSLVPLGSGSIEWEFSWRDSKNNVLLIESVNMVTYGPDNYVLDIPVKGSLCRVRVTNHGFSDDWFSDKVEFFGTSRVLACRANYVTYPVQYPPGVGTSSLQSFGRGWARIPEWNGFAGNTFLPQWGNQLNLSMSATNVTMAGILYVQMLAESTLSIIDTYPVTTGAFRLSANVIVPTGCTPVIIVVGAAMSAAPTLSLIWSDYE